MKHMCCMLLGPAISKRVTCIIMHKHNEKDTYFFSAFVYFIFLGQSMNGIVQSVHL